MFDEFDGERVGQEIGVALLSLLKVKGYKVKGNNQYFGFERCVKLLDLPIYLPT